MRAESCGPADASLQANAVRWSLSLGRPVTPAQVVLCTIDPKLVRLTHDPGHRDSLVDVIGHAALLPEVQR